MTKREYWLKLFSENDIALAAAIHLCTKGSTLASLESGRDFLLERRKELYEEVDQEIVVETFCGAKMNAEVEE